MPSLEYPERGMYFIVANAAFNYVAMARNDVTQVTVTEQPIFEYDANPQEICQKVGPYLDWVPEYPIFNPQEPEAITANQLLEFSQIAVIARVEHEHEDGLNPLEDERYFNAGSPLPIEWLQGEPLLTGDIREYDGQLYMATGSHPTEVVPPIDPLMTPI